MRTQITYKLKNDKGQYYTDDWDDDFWSFDPGDAYPFNNIEEIEGKISSYGEDDGSTDKRFPKGTYTPEIAIRIS